MKKEFCIMNDNPPYIEIWKDIKGYEGLYQVSNLGRVKSLLFRNNITAKKRETPLIMKFTKRSGYYNIVLRNEKGRKSFQIHRLVAQTFIPNPNNKPFVNHINFNRLDNNINNLEWCTQKENVQHSICNMKVRKSITHSNTKEKYISYRKSRNEYRIIIDKKEYKSCKTLKEAIKRRNEILNEKI